MWYEFVRSIKHAAVTWPNVYMFIVMLETYAPRAGLGDDSGYWPCYQNSARASDKTETANTCTHDATVAASCTKITAQK